MKSDCCVKMWTTTDCTRARVLDAYPKDIRDPLRRRQKDCRHWPSKRYQKVIFGLDENTGDGEAGFVTLIKKFDAPTTPVDSVRVPGTFLVGGHTLFINPSNSGSDAFVDYFQELRQNNIPELNFGFGVRKKDTP